MRKLVFILVCWLSLPLAVLAQENGPLIGSQASDAIVPLVAPTTEDSTLRILVIGDSMAGGLGAGMARVAAGDNNIQVVSRFNESSAIARPDVYNWPLALPKMMEGKNFNVAVVLIGLNDRQDIRSPAGRLAFNSVEWVKAYQSHTDEILDALKAQNVKIFWLGEPPMGDAAYDADMKTVTALQRDRAVAKGAIFIDTRPALSNPDGSYMDFGPDDTGEIKKLRQRDGVTFLKQGNNRFGQIILAAIKDGGVAPMPAPVQPEAVADVGGPMFGQEDANGAPLIHDSTAMVVAADTTLPAAGPATSDAAAAFVGSLFTTGEASVAPAGRFDDFSYEAPVAN